MTWHMRRSSLRSADGGVRSWCGAVCSREKGFSFSAAYLAPASRPVSSEQIGLRWVVLLAAGWGWSGVSPCRNSASTILSATDKLIARIDLKLDDNSSFERSAYFPTTPRFPGRAILDIDTTFDVNYATVSRLLPSGTWWNPNWSSRRHIFLVSCDLKSGSGDPGRETPHDKSCAECAPLWRA